MASKRGKKRRTPHGKQRSGGRSQRARKAAPAGPQVRRRDHQMFPVIPGHAGLTPLDQNGRAVFLDQFDVDSTWQALVAIRSRIDVATTSDWSEGRVELELFES